MMLGNRSRPRESMKRTTSMTEFSFDDLSFLNHPLPPSDNDQTPVESALVGSTNNNDQVGSTNNNDQQRGGLLPGLVSPRLLLNRRNSADFARTKSASSSYSFLRSCSLCRCRLARGRDIFMYKGDTAFCSSECRQQQMAQDEWTEKCATKQAISTSSTSEGETSTAL